MLNEYHDFLVFNFRLETTCVCSSEYTLNFNNNGKKTLVGAYCNVWDPKYPDTSYCYLKGRMKAASCDGAIKSGLGNFYWTEDESICERSRYLMERSTKTGKFLHKYVLF